MAKPKSFTPAKKTGDTISGKDVLYAVLMLKTEYGIDTVGLQDDAEYVALQTTMRHNRRRTKKYNGVLYAIGGRDAGRDNPSKGLQDLLDCVDGKAYTKTGKKRKAPDEFKKLQWRTDREASKCKVCGMKLGEGVKYTLVDEKTGAETEGKSPCYSLSHGVPSIFFGSTDDANVMVECRRCNSQRGDRMPKPIRRWIEEMTFDVYETETETETETEETETEE